MSVFRRTEMQFGSSAVHRRYPGESALRRPLIRLSRPLIVPLLTFLCVALCFVPEHVVQTIIRYRRSRPTGINGVSACRRSVTALRGLVTGHAARSMMIRAPSPHENYLVLTIPAGILPGLCRERSCSISRRIGTESSGMTGNTAISHGNRFESDAFTFVMAKYCTPEFLKTRTPA